MSGPFEFSTEENEALTAMQTEAPQPEVKEEVVAEVTDPDDIVTEEEPKAEDQGDKPKRTMVPQQALHQERERRKTIEAENQRFREERAALNERLAMIRERDERKAEEPVAMPDPDQDPFGAIKWMQAKLQTQEQERQQYQQQYQQQDQQNRQWQQFVGTAVQQAEQYAAENPEFSEAYASLIASRTAELELAGYTKQEAKASLEREEADIIWRAQQRGENPAKVMHQLAKNRGWQPKQALTAEVDKIKTAAKGVATNRSLTTAGGASGSTEMTAESLIKMSREDFSAWCDEHPKKAKALLGG